MNKYIDLHLHLDGAITPEIAKKLAKLQGIKLPAVSDAQLEAMLSLPEDCENLNDFLKCFALPLTLLQTREGLSEAVRLIQDQLVSQGVIYAEIRFAPQLHCDKGLSQKDAIEAALEGLKQSALPCNLILCCMRGADSDTNLETVELAKDFLVEDGGVTALDLAGAEALFPTTDYKALFARAKEYGIPFTIHAGEAAGADSVKAALEFGANRIGHGVRSFEDPEVLQLLASHHIPLEMCPTSNRQTCVLADMKDYPLKKFLELGLCVTLNTDDPAICRTTQEKEFAYARNSFSLNDEDCRQILRNSIQAAFTSKSRRKALLKILEG